MLRSPYNVFIRTFCFWLDSSLKIQKILWEREKCFVLKNLSSSAEPLERQVGNLIEQVILLEGCLTVV